jgi:Fungal protein kinase
MWIWYFDRQGIIYSQGMSFIQDLPRFLVLLFAFQRFDLEDWGVISIFNPNAKRAHMDVTDVPEDHLRYSGRVKKKPRYQATNARDQRKERATTIDINLSELQQLKCFLPNLESVSLELKRFLSPEPHCIAGRATAVIEATGKTSTGELRMVCKLYHPEIQRRHEGVVMQTVSLIARNEAPDMLKHLPTLYFYGDLPKFTTNRIRSIIGVSWKGHRTTRLIGLKKLQEITTLTSGPKFTKAWLDVVTCE